MRTHVDPSLSNRGHAPAPTRRARAAVGAVLVGLLTLMFLSGCNPSSPGGTKVPGTTLPSKLPGIPTTVKVTVLPTTTRPAVTTTTRPVTTTTRPTVTTTRPVPTTTRPVATTTTIRPTTTTTRPVTTTTTTTRPTTTTTAPVTTYPAGTRVIRVVGNHLVDATGKTVQLHGVNYGGTEHRCIQDTPYGGGFINSDTPSDGRTLAYAEVMMSQVATWRGINALRIPINENCWLGGGLNGIEPTYSGQAYRNFISAEVDAALARGIYPILDLHWSAPGSNPAWWQDVAPNADHDVTLWQQVADQFKGRPGVLFELYNEPHISGMDPQLAWQLYRNGGTYNYRTGDVKPDRYGTIQIAGTQQLVTTIRNTGAKNAIIVDGLDWGNQLLYFQQYRPVDPAGQLVAAIHTYPQQQVTVDHGLDQVMAEGNLLKTTPVIISEFGEPCGQASAPAGFAERTMYWADLNGVSWTAWAFDAEEGCAGPSLVSNMTSLTPNAYGLVVKNHLAYY